MKRFHKKWAMLAICTTALSQSAKAGEIIDLYIGAYLNVCSEAAAEMQCEYQGLPEDEAELLKQIELQEVEDAPGLSMGVYTEKKLGFEYGLSISKMEIDGTPPFYSVVASVRSEQGSNTKLQLPSSTAFLVNSIREIPVVTHDGASIRLESSLVHQPGIIFGWEDPSKTASIKQLMQKEVTK